MSKMAHVNSVVVLFVFVPSWVMAIDWPVFFEQLGNVHSIHNKWDLALNVHIDLPALQARNLKILHRLDLLNNDFIDPDAPPTRKAGIPSRLDELNKSWREQNRQISRRCDNIKRRAEDLVELGEHSLYKREAGKDVLSRKKRQNYNAEGLLKALFGLAYNDDVQSMQSKLKSIDSRLSNDLNSVRTQTHKIRTSTQEVISRQANELENMETLARKLQRKVITMETNPFMKTSISDLVHVRNEAYKKLALEVDLVEERLVEVESVVTALGSGKLSKSVISPKKLKETLFNIETQLPANYALLFGSDFALWPYYSSIGANSVFDKNLEEVVVTISIPLVDKSSILQLHRVHNLPLKVRDGYSVIADVSTEYIVTDENRLYFLELFKEDFQDCQVFHHQGEQFYCGLSPMLKAESARSCVMQLFQGHADPAWCQSRLKNGNVQPFNRLYNGSWIYSAMYEQVPVNIECPESSTPAKLSGFGVFNLDKGCTMTSEEFFYAHTFAGMVEVNIDFGDEEENAWIANDNLDGDPKDYDLDNFMHDSLLDIDNDILGEALVQESQRLVKKQGENNDDLSSTEASEDDTEATTTGTEAETNTEKNSGTDETDSKEVKSGAGLHVLEDPNAVTTVYKDLLIKLKKKLSGNWIQLS